MSNRTSEANKAIALAWTKERELLREGKGTRDWTPEQQQSILDRGKAYDDDGKAFEGHHMKSAEKHPEYQGDPENIQFLSRSEHFAAHDGNFQNFTNGCFDPYTGETSDFGLNKYEPCKILELSEPTIIGDGQPQETAENISISSNISVDDKNTDVHISPSLNKSGGNRFGGKGFVDKAVEFCVRHKEDITRFFVTVFVTVIAEEIVKKTLDGSSKSNKRNYEDNDDFSTYSSSVSTNEENTSVSVQHEDTVERSSPNEHTVSAHRQRYNGEWKDKDSYKRGKNSDE